MNILLFESDEILSDQSTAVIRDPRRLNHLRDVLNVTSGKNLRVGIRDGMMGVGTLLNMDDAGAELLLSLYDPPPPKLSLTLVLALPRPKSLKKALAAAVTLGVSSIHLIHTARTDKAYWQTPFLLPDQLDELLLLALEQAVDTVAPEICMHRRFRPFAEDILPQLCVGKQAFVAHPCVEALTCPCNLSDPVLLSIGPEGGWVPFEFELLMRAGLNPVQIGARILRVEQAVSALIGRLMPIH